MTQTITAVFDGKAFQPEEPVKVKANTRYRLTITPIGEEHAPPPGKDEAVWDLLDRLTGTIQAPGDWAKEHDHYIHGTPKRNEKKGE